KLIPTALIIDCCPCSGGDRRNALWILFEEVPCAAGFINDVVVVVEDGDREFVAAQIFPDVLDRIEFRSVRWQTHKGDVFGDRERRSNMIAGAIEDESGVATCRHLVADSSEMQRHGLGVRRRHDEACCDTTLRTGRAEQVGPVVASVMRRAGPRSTLGPDAGQRALLADPGFILEPNFDRLAFGAVRDLRCDCRGEVFLNASWASSSACGWRGLTDSLRWPSLARTFPTERSWSATPKRRCNSSRRSTRRQRTTPCTAGSGPASTSSANSACCRAVSFDPGPGDLRLRSPASPAAL